MEKLRFATQIVNLPQLDGIELPVSRCAHFISQGPETCWVGESVGPELVCL
jgi:hypothetical protein